MNTLLMTQPAPTRRFRPDTRPCYLKIYQISNIYTKIYIYNIFIYSNSHAICLKQYNILCGISPASNTPKFCHILFLKNSLFCLLFSMHQKLTERNISVTYSITFQYFDFRHCAMKLHASSWCLPA